uniref:TIL domain-containing protein n=1 Tax=Ditylenchus dipsaci TaxID=166011 RepID=A0A915D2L9_9BILA
MTLSHKSLIFSVLLFVAMVVVPVQSCSFGEITNPLHIICERNCTHPIPNPLHCDKSLDCPCAAAFARPAGGGNCMGVAECKDEHATPSP